MSTLAEANSHDSNYMALLIQNIATVADGGCPTFEERTVIYRVIRSDESCASGLIAKDTDAKKTVHDYIANGSKYGYKSQYTVYMVIFT